MRACGKEMWILTKLRYSLQKNAPSNEHFRQELYKANTAELMETWPTCFWCAGIAPRDAEVHDRNMALPDFTYDEPDPPHAHIRT